MGEVLKDKLFLVEHALSMHAYSFVYFPAFGIYDKDMLRQFQETISNCHIYMIGLVPIVDFCGARQEDRTLLTLFSILGETHELDWPIPDGLELHYVDDLWYLADESGERYFPNEQAALWRLSVHRDLVNFKVEYIGQAFGKDGSRNALDRLRKHETLQKISLQGTPKGHRLEIILLEIQPDNIVVTMFNPWAADTESAEQRIASGTNKLFGTTEAERITLFEASLIRYFMPKFNTEFKDSFPSTNMKVLRDCYEKDFSAIVAEICFDEMPFKIFSDAVPPKQYHVVKHDLHDQESRKVFFG